MSGDMRPFSCGTQFGDWTMANCDKCRSNGYVEGSTCGLLDNLAAAAFGDGMIDHATAEGIGANRFKGYYNWPCPTFKHVETGEGWELDVFERREGSLVNAEEQR